MDTLISDLSREYISRVYEYLSQEVTPHLPSTKDLSNRCAIALTGGNLKSFSFPSGTGSKGLPELVAKAISTSSLVNHLASANSGSWPKKILSSSARAIHPIIKELAGNGHG